MTRPLETLHGLGALGALSRGQGGIDLPGPGAAMPDPALLRAGRVHEAAGPGRRAFAAALAGRLTGAVLWLQESRTRDRLCPPGLASVLDPARLILVSPVGARAMLQVLEEALRSGAAPLVVAELDRAPDLTDGRRLQLAAGTGGGRGLVLLAEAGSPTAETRWRCTPCLAGGQAGPAAAPQRWEIVKNKRGRPGAWTVAREGGAWRVGEAAAGEAAMS